ncbi:MAG: SulP family inorganic anion transporter, partial [Desulfobacterales bacterium]|nr:SulP family inorganic anion transporter [Desulfobacterales bacterium]
MFKIKLFKKKDNTKNFEIPILQGIIPVDKTELGRDILAGFTLAALAIPGTMGYTKIIGTPVITGMYTILIPMCLFAIFGSSRHLSVGADSATAAVVAARCRSLYLSTRSALSHQATGIFTNRSSIRHRFPCRD